MFRVRDIAVYPRWRGELEIVIVFIHSVIGLSPLAWGTRSPRDQRLHVNRFIPAGVGNSPDQFDIKKRSSVYPRWRGELTPYNAHDTSGTGLSPLAWGTQLRKSDVFIVTRFIPAGVGNSKRPVNGELQPAVYPRWRGELACTSTLMRFGHGLSPLAWGTLSEERDLILRRRFIPAGVGNSLNITYY